MAIVVNIDVMMARRKMSLNELSEKVDITPANLSILKNGKAKAIRFSTLEAICRVLNCQPGDILEYIPETKEETGKSTLSNTNWTTDCTLFCKKTTLLPTL